MRSRPRKPIIPTFPERVRDAGLLPKGARACASYVTSVTSGPRQLRAGGGDRGPPNGGAGYGMQARDPSVAAGGEPAGHLRLSRRGRRETILCEAVEILGLVNIMMGPHTHSGRFSLSTTAVCPLVCSSRPCLHCALHLVRPPF